MKQPHSHRSKSFLPARYAARNAALALAGLLGRVLPWCWAGLQKVSVRVGAAAARAERRIAEQFNVPPGGG